MEITERKLVSRAKLKGKRLHVLEDVLIDMGAAFTVLPPEIADFLELEVNRETSYSLWNHRNSGESS